MPTPPPPPPPTSPCALTPPLPAPPPPPSHLVLTAFGHRRHRRLPLCSPPLPAAAAVTRPSTSFCAHRLCPPPPPPPPPRPVITTSARRCRRRHRRHLPLHDPLYDSNSAQNVGSPVRSEEISSPGPGTTEQQPGRGSDDGARHCGHGAHPQCCERRPCTPSGPDLSNRAAASAHRHLRGRQLSKRVSQRPTDLAACRGCALRAARGELHSSLRQHRRRRGAELLAPGLPLDLLPAVLRRQQDCIHCGSGRQVGAHAPTPTWILVHVDVQQI
eukprot:SAG11_NODE_4659_length_1818_cov_1.195462_1_plen_272_part_00